MRGGGGGREVMYSFVYVFNVVCPFVFAVSISAAVMVTVFEPICLHYVRVVSYYSILLHLKKY